MRVALWGSATLLVFFVGVFSLSAKESVQYVTATPGVCTGFEAGDNAREISVSRSAFSSAFSFQNSAVHVFQPSAGSPQAPAELNCSSFTLPESVSGVSLENALLTFSLALERNGTRDDVLSLSYSTDRGETWISLESFVIPEQMSNITRGGYVTYPLSAFGGLTDIANLMVRVRYSPDPDAPEGATFVFVDGTALEAEQLPEPKKLELKEGDYAFSKVDIPATGQPEFSLVSEHRSFWGFLGADPRERTIEKAILTDPSGVTVPITISTKSDVDDGKKTRTTFAVPSDVFTTPGKYQMTLTIREDDAEAIITQDFTWGVLALNVSKSVVLPGETVFAGMGVLSPAGDTICDAELDLRVTDPNGVLTTYGTETGEIVRSDECGPETVTSVPDYSVSFPVDTIGSYGLELTARTSAGEYTVSDSMQVQEQVAFDVLRNAPTRIYPEADYTVQLAVTPEEDFSGTVTESVPADFALSNMSPEATVQDTENARKEIVWNVSWRAGETVTLSYTFDAPNVSPEFYLLGPARFGDAFAEARQWQIASDATDNFIAFWDGGAAPAGWTCISCAGGDPLYQKFPRGAATYGGTGGAATHTHTISLVSLGSASASPFNNVSGTATVSLKAHSHTISGTSMNSGTSLPVYQNVKVIRYDTTGTPATIPSGVILMFDAVPAGSWSRYTAQDGDFLYGENDASGTGGAATHTHSSVGYSMDAATGNVSLSDLGATVSGSADGHTHTVSGATTASGTHTPPYIDVLLYQATGDTTLPDGAIAMWDDTPVGAGWDVISGATETFDAKFLRGNSAYGGTGGATTHTHTNLTSTSSGPSGATGTADTGTKSGASTSHTHSVQVSFGNGNNLPPYLDVIIAKYDLPDLSGRIYTDEGTTGLDCATPRTVDLRINGTGTSTAECSNTPSNGSFIFSGLTLASGDIVTVYLDDETEKATTVFVSDGTSQTNVDLYQDRVIVRADTGSLTNANLSTGDDADADVLYNVSAGALSVDSGKELHVWTGDTFAPAGSVTTQGGGNLHIGSSATLNAAGNAVNINGTLDNDGTYTTGANTTTFNATSGTVTIDSTSAFNNVVFNDATGSATYTHSSALDINGTFTLTDGIFQQGANVNLNIAGSISLAANSTFTKASGSGLLILDGDLTFTDSHVTKQDMGNVHIGTSPDTTDLASDFSATSLTVNAADILNTNGYDLDIGTGGITISGTLDATDDVEVDETAITNEGLFDLNSGGTFTQDQSTVTFDGTSGTDDITDDATLTFYNFILNDAGGSLQVDAESSFEVSNNLTITGGTLNIQSGMTVTHNGATLTLSDIISGAGRLTYTSATNFPTTGTISSILRFDMTSTAMNIPVRTYGGLVEIYANTASTRTATALGAGTTTMTGGLSISTSNAAVTFDHETNDPTLTVSGPVTIGSGTTYNASSTATTSFADSYTNNGTFTANTGTIRFTATDSGNTISGTLNGSSALYIVIFNGSGGSWTIQDAMLVSAANNAAAFDIQSGTVTMGNGDNDDLEVRGGLDVASTANETGTFQTAAVAEGSNIIIDLNQNSSAPACSNCIIEVGATSGSGSGTFTINKNTIVRLNPGSLSASDTGIEVYSTGNATIQGSQDATGTSDGTTDETTLTDSSKSWTNSEHVNKVVRITNSSSLAFGMVYSITANTATTLTRADNSSANTTIASTSGTTNTRKICSAANTLITANNEGIGRYIHDATGSTGYLKIVDSTNNDGTCSSNDSFLVIAEPGSFSIMTNGDTIDISDGVQANDTYEILDYTHVTAENGTACTAATGGSGEGFIRANASSQLTIQYAEVCNLGRNVSSRYGVEVSSLTAGANAGVLINKSSVHDNYTIVFSSANDHSLANGLGITNSLIYGNDSYNLQLSGSDRNYFANNRIYAGATWNVNIFGASDTNTFTGNYIYNSPSHGFIIQGSGSNSNTVTSNISYNNSGYGLYGDTDFNTYSSNTVFGNTNIGIYFATGADNNTVSSNTTYTNQNNGIRMFSLNNCVVSSNNVYDNTSYGIFLTTNNCVFSGNTVEYNALSGFSVYTSTYNTFRGNTVRSNQTAGYYIRSIVANDNIYNRYVGNSISGHTNGAWLDGATPVINQYFINENFGGAGVNTNDFSFASGQTQNAFLYNTTLASGTEANGISATNSFLISRKHDGTNGATKIWGEYSIPSDTAETPQDEDTNQFNYANVLWPDSVTPHGYRVGAGAGSEDTNLAFSFSGAMGGDQSAYDYRVVCNAANCVTTGSSWDVYRNGTLLTNKASTASTYTDSQVDGSGAPNVQFTIEDAGTDYTTGATYTFVAYKGSGDTSTQKAITVAQDGDIFTAGSGTTLELKGQNESINQTTVTRGASGGYKFVVGGTIDADGYSFNYLGGASQASGLDIDSTATVTNLDNGFFDNFGTNVGVSDSFIDVDSTLIGAGTPSKQIYKIFFGDTNGNADCNVNATGVDAAGYWEFLNSGGAFDGESFDCNDGAADGTPGQIAWGDPSITFALSDTAIGFGTLSSSAASYANGDESGSASEVEAHTVTVSTTSSSGYTLTVNGTTLTSGSDTITAIGSTNTASSPGTEQFGLRMTASGGSGSVSAPYAASGFALDTAAFPDAVASATGADTGTTYSARYLANIASLTEAGKYTCSLTYVATGNF